MFVNYSNDSKSPQVCLDGQRNVFGLHTVVVHKSAVVFLGSLSASDNMQLTSRNILQGLICIF